MAMQLLVESLTLDSRVDIVQKTELKESLDNGTLLVEGHSVDVLNVYKVPISRPGEKNRNNRTYTLEDTWKPVLEQRMGENSVGLLNHPEPGKAPDFRDSCCVWRNIRLENGPAGKPLIYADMYLLKDKKGNGDLIESIIKAGGNVDVSTRGYGELTTEGLVHSYRMESIDVVNTGSYNVQFGQKDRIQMPGVTVGESAPASMTESGKKDQSKSVVETTNNHKISVISEGENTMASNKILIKKAINEAFAQSNKFQAFTELTSIAADLKTEAGMEDLAKLAESKAELLNNALTEAYAVSEADTQGDANDAGEVAIYPDPEKKIKDSDEKKPDDVKEIDVEDIDDTSDSDRDEGAARNYQPGSSKKSMKSEVMSGEVSHESIEIPADMPIYEDSEGTFVISEGNKIYVVLEDTDESEPDDVKEVEVEDIDDTTDADREGSMDIVPGNADGEIKEGKKWDATKKAVTGEMKKDWQRIKGAPKAAWAGLKKAPKAALKLAKENPVKTGVAATAAAAYGAKKLHDRKNESVNLYKLDKEALIDTVASMDEAVKELQSQVAHERACYESLEDYTLKLETYTLKAERVVESEKADKDVARTEVAEAVEYAQSLQEQLDQTLSTLNEQATYIAKLEEQAFLTESADVKASVVSPYVRSLVVSNPSLAIYEGQLNKCASISEVIELANTFKVNRGRVRIDSPLTEGVGPQTLDEAVGNSETSKVRSIMRARGMI